MQDKTDEHLMEQVQKGENKALEQLFANHKQSLINFFFRMSGDLNISENLLQDTFTRVYLYRNSYSIDKRFFPWLYQVARNTWATHYKRGLTNPVSAAHELVPETSISAGNEIKYETNQLVLFALQQLHETDRQLVVLYHLQGFEYTELSALFEISEGNLRVKLCRALKTLGAILKKAGYEYQ
jgi:RNA polymerase sigma factor (sigma-70 family)